MPISRALGVRASVQIESHVLRGSCTKARSGRTAGSDARINAMSTSARLLLFALAGAAGMLHAGQPRFVQDGYRLDSLVFENTGDIAEGDFDADGKAELALTGWSSRSIPYVERRPVLAILDHDNGEYRLSHRLLLPSNAQPVTPLAWSEAGVDRIVLVDRGGMASVFSGVPLAESFRFPIVNDVRAAAIGDVDADGGQDLLLLDRNGFYTYELPSGRLSETYLAPGHADLAVAQLDADPALEIVLSGALLDAKVVDGATLSTEWTYAAGFGDLLATGNFFGNDTQQWVGVLYRHDYAVFGSAPWGAGWHVTSEGEIKAIGTARSASDSRDMLLVGPGQWGYLNVVDGISGQTTLSARNDGDYILSATGEDIDGDAIDELVFASDVTSERATALTAADGTDGSIRWQFHTTKTPYSAATHGDVDGDGQVELVVANRASYTSTVAIFDAADDALLWRSPAESAHGEPWQTQILAIALRERTGDIGMDIVVAGEWGSSWRIYVLDGVTKNIGLDVRGFGSGPLAQWAPIDMVLVDHDGDSAKDIAMLMRDTGAGGALSIALWSAQGQLLWQSAPFGDFKTAAHSLLAIPDAIDAHPHLLAVLDDGIRAFDATNGQESWQLSAPGDGAAFIASGQSGPEIALYLSDGSVGFYDATTRALLRQRRLPAPLRSLQALDGEVHRLLAAASDRLMLVDGRSGEVRSESGVLSSFWRDRQPLSATRIDDSDWILASPTSIALHRLRIETPDEIFEHGFE